MSRPTLTTPQARAERARQLAQEVPLEPFLILNAAVKELYGTAKPELDEQKLSEFYTRVVPQGRSSDWRIFRDLMRQRFDLMASRST